MVAGRPVVSIDHAGRPADDVRAGGPDRGRRSARRAGLRRSGTLVAGHAGCPRDGLPALGPAPGLDLPRPAAAAPPRAGPAAAARSERASCRLASLRPWSSPSRPRPRWPDVAAGRGHYESYYLRAVDPTGSRAASGSGTRCPSRRVDGRTGQLWFTLLRPVRPAPRAVRVDAGRATTGAGRVDRGWATSTFGPAGIEGRAGSVCLVAAQPGRRARAGAPPPATGCTGRRLPRTKLLSLSPAALFDGTRRGRRGVDLRRRLARHGRAQLGRAARRAVDLAARARLRGRRADTWLDVAVGRVRIGPGRHAVGRQRRDVPGRRADPRGRPRAPGGGGRRGRTGCALRIPARGATVTAHRLRAGRRLRRVGLRRPDAGPPGASGAQLLGGRPDRDRGPSRRGAGRAPDRPARPPTSGAARPDAGSGRRERPATASTGPARPSDPSGSRRRSSVDQVGQLAVAQLVQDRASGAAPRSRPGSPRGRRSGGGPPRASSWSRPRSRRRRARRRRGPWSGDVRSRRRAAAGTGRTAKPRGWSGEPGWATSSRCAVLDEQDAAGAEDAGRLDGDGVEVGHVMDQGRSKTTSARLRVQAGRGGVAQVERRTPARLAVALPGRVEDRLAGVDADDRGGAEVVPGAEVGASAAADVDDVARRLGSTRP